MSAAEVTEFHARLADCSLQVEHCRAYWQRSGCTGVADVAQAAFSEYWFGARSAARVQQLLANFRERFDRFPEALAVLQRWTDMGVITRKLICHWHLQLTDRLYREFTGQFLWDRVQTGRGEVTRDVVVRWLENAAPGRWSTSSRIQLGRKLLYSATEAGLLRGRRDPRGWQAPRVDDEALGYILHLLRKSVFHGSLIENPYLASVGLVGQDLQRRLQSFPHCELRQQGDLFEFVWRYQSLSDWAAHNLPGVFTPVREIA